MKGFVEIKVQARVLRTIDKVGGLDEYLLGNKKARLKELGMGGWALRWKIGQTEMVRERFRLERERLGVPEGGWEGLIRKMKSEGKGKGRELGLDTKIVVIGGGNEEVKEDVEPIKEKAFMEEEDFLAKSLEQKTPPAR